MPPKFKKKLSASASKDLEDTHEETKTPPPKKGKAKAADAGRPTPPKRTISAVSEGDSQKPKRGKKAKEGPYTCYKEQGSIPEPELPRRSDALPAGKKAFTVLSWNVGGLRAFLKSRKKDLENAVQLASSPAVIGIMEHKLQDSTADSEAALKELSETLPDYELACVNYSTAKKGYSGVLVLLRKEAPRPVAVTAEDLPSAAQEGRIVVLEFETVYVVVCYVPNSGDQLKRLTQRIEEWDVQLRQRLQDLGKKKHVLLMGDLNVAHQDKDIWNVEAPHVPKSAGTTNEERESFSKLIDSGFKDGFSLRHPEVLGAFTYWSVRAGNRPKNRGLRLDYAMVSDSLVSAQEHQTHFWDAFHLPAVATGDHCPVGAVLAV